MQTKLSSYFFNCFLLMLPVMAWNILMTGKLPEAFQPEIFQHGIPSYITYPENIFRLMLMVLTFLMPLSIRSSKQKVGLILYIVGIVAYLFSWIVLIYAPGTKWSNSIWGFISPAYTPVLWLTGIALIGGKLNFGIPYRRWIFLLLAMCFLIFHNLHACMVYKGIQ